MQILSHFLITVGWEFPQKMVEGDITTPLVQHWSETFNENQACHTRKGE
jgi:hypothetical protein